MNVPAWILRCAQNDSRRNFLWAGCPHPARHALRLAAFLTLTLTLPAQENSEPAPLAAQSLLLAVARAGDNLVAVGDRGHVLLSSDSGKSWTQSLTPTRAMLTGVSFPDALHGWAVGHDGVILATTDGGLTWTRQDDGKALDTVWLDVLFRDALHGWAIGAYGKFSATTDGGKTWTAAKLLADEVHFNRISAGIDGYLYIAGESGTVLVSHDDGRVWDKVDVPYDGSLFGVVPLADSGLVAYGLRGHILRSANHGRQWTELNNDIKVIIMGGLRRRNGTVVLAGQGGNFFVSHDAGQSFAPWKPAGFVTSVAALAEAADGALIAVGEAGATRLDLP